MTASTPKTRIAAAFHEQAEVYDRHIQVQKRVARQLAESIVLGATRHPSSILDVGSGTGTLLSLLHGYFPSATLIGADIALNMCMRAAEKIDGFGHIVAADAERIPFKDGSFDLVVSTSVLQWVGNLERALSEIVRVTRPGGDIRIAFFIAGTLFEMQNSFTAAVADRPIYRESMLAKLHVFRQVDEVNSMLQKLDLESMVACVETEVDWYPDLHSLLKGIKIIGAGSVTGGGSGLGWRGVLKETANIYRDRYEVGGKIPASYRILYMTARKKG